MSDLMTTSEVARRAGVSGAAVNQWERKGKLPAEKTETGQRIFRREDVERFLAERANGRKLQ